MIPRLLQPLDALGSGYAARRDHQKVIAHAPSRAGVQGLPGEVEAGHLLHLEVDFRSQQRTLGPFQVFLEIAVEGNVHEGRFVIMIRRIRQQFDRDLVFEYFRVKLSDQLIGEHRAAYTSPHDDNSFRHSPTPWLVLNPCQVP